MNNDLIINGQKVKIIEWNGQRVITTQEMANHHHIETKRLNEKFRRNRKYFVENKDFYIVSKQKLKDAKCDLDLFTSNEEVYLFTESGYLRFVKTINDDRAWEIYNQLIESYFIVKRLNQIEKQFLEKTKENRKGLTSEWSRHEAKNYAMLTIGEYESLFQDSEIRKKDMNDKELSLLSAFEFLEYRKLENNPQIKGDEMLIDSMNDTGNKINSIVNKQLTNNK
jgi:hypothetical protein